MKILLVYPEFPDTFWSFKHALRFIRRKASSQPLGLITIAAMLPEEWEKRLVDMNVSPLKESDLLWADLVFVSAMTIQRKSVYEVLDRAKTLNKKIVAGGPLFTMEPEAFPQVDHLIMNEGELTFPPFLEDLAVGKPKPRYDAEGHADITKTPAPMWDLIDMRKYDTMAVQYSRGCPFGCDFCNVTALLGHKMRLKTTGQFISELGALYDRGWRRNVFIVDDNFIGNKRALKEDLLPALIEWRKGKKASFSLPK